MFLCAGLCLEKTSGVVASEHLLVELLSPTGDINLGIFTKENLPLLHHHLPLGVPQRVCGHNIKQISGAIAGDFTSSR